MTIPEKLKAIQNYRNLTVQQMSDWFGVNKSTYEHWLYGRSAPSDQLKLQINGVYNAIITEQKEKVDKWVGLGVAGVMLAGAWWLMEGQNDDEIDEFTPGYDED